MKLRLYALFGLLSLSFSLCALATVYPYTQGNRLTLLEESRASADLKLELVKQAKDHIHIITFFWDESEFPQELARELIAANKRGVEVRVLTSFFPSFMTDLFGSGRKPLIKFEADEKDAAVFSFLALKSYDNLVLFNSLHEKIFLVDGEKAILGGRNISDSRFVGKDMEVLVEGEAVNQIQNHFHKMSEFVIDLFINKKCKRDDSKKCQKTKKEFEPVRFPKSLTYFPEQPDFEEGIEARILTHEVLIDQLKTDYVGFSERVNIQDDIVDTVANTEFETLRGYNYFILPTAVYRDFLEKSLAQGKRIELFTNSYQSASTVSNKGYLLSLTDMVDLSEKGLKLIEWQGLAPQTYLHSKVMIFDDERVMIGSHNFGVGSTSVSNEIMIEFTSAKIAARLIEIFESDKANPEIAKPVDTEFLQNFKHKHRKMIALLKITSLEDILKELY